MAETAEQLAETFGNRQKTLGAPVWDGMDVLRRLDQLEAENRVLKTQYSSLERRLGEHADRLTYLEEAHRP